MLSLRLGSCCGRCIQVIVHGGLSKMQEAEADMAKDKGVPVIKLRLDEEVMKDSVLPLTRIMQDKLKKLAAAMKKAPELEPRDASPGGWNLPAGQQWKTVEVLDDDELPLLA